MKRSVLYVCVGAMMIGLAACGNGDKDADASTESSSVEMSVVVDPDMLDGGNFMVDPSGNAGGDGDEGDNAGWSGEMSALRDAVVQELGEDYWPNAEMSAEYLETTFGLTSDMYEDFMGEMPLISAQVDTLLIVKAAEGKADTVEEKILAYQKNLMEDTMQYPSNLDKIQGSKVERVGDYISFALLGGDITEQEEQGSDAVIVYVQEQNQRALDVIRENLPQ